MARIIASVVIRTAGLDERLTAARSCDFELVVRTARSGLWALMATPV
jgi:hypothetical protein